MKKDSALSWQEKLGKIWAKLNNGIKVENLSVSEQEILCQEYGDEWKQKVQQRTIGLN